MAKSRPAGISALRCVVPPLRALILARRLIGRHCQCTRSLGIAASDGSLSFGPGQGSLGGKSGTSEQHGEQDTKHKAHDVTPSQIFLTGKINLDAFEYTTDGQHNVGNYCNPERVRAHVRDFDQK